MSNGRAPQLSPISIPQSQRLAAIFNDEADSAFASPRTPPIPPRSDLRDGTSQHPQSATSSNRPLVAERSEHSSVTHAEGPPAYNWVPDPVGEDNVSEGGPVEGEKLASLRQQGGWRRDLKRGGWGRICLIALGILLLIGLIIGLAVGLTVGRRGNGNNKSSSNTAESSENATSLPFPIGQYSIVTSLRDTNTDCTSNAATWTCGSTTQFQWIMTNTSSNYATNSTSLTTSDDGVPANLTISTTNNPLSITFSNISLTYHNPASNASAERYTFSYQQSKSVIPTVPLVGNQVAQCYFNQTTFTGTLYLGAQRSGDGQQLPADVWPYAVEIEQVSPGGEDVPACYQWNDGVDGERIQDVLTPQAEGAECSCDYRNF
ncbi:unnamed protein product [Zymoseptoria tritici ST99CH_1A5]|uniref:Tat pathway signal sequence n=1 Tax=Zymoseptoria tritici ST99CH_1A5 TaxID=1276529 RepID=A0A1Y6LJQ0_ZYMTR|nr:unnamed protein product [Zymoseptoria tritici ST99CH_1A5]